MAHFKAFLGSHQDLGTKTAVPVLGTRLRLRSELKTLDTLVLATLIFTCPSLSSLLQRFIARDPAKAFGGGCGATEQGCQCNELCVLLGFLKRAGCLTVSILSSVM